ncbi:MAG: ABC transporter ATP-binding protein, partial [Acidimicrobiia bacterium]|nr:ABC transporter ATP-binding protein [Acidimicrobiia bacterium]
MIDGATSGIIDLRGVEKVYRTGAVEYPALRGVDLRVEPGEMVAVIGPSGSGKSTVLNLITGIDRPSAGVAEVDGRDIAGMSEDELAVWRGRRVGIVFQFFQLLPTLNALENAILPLEFARIGSAQERRERATENLELVGLADKLHHLPSELSGGEQQRVAIARALATGNPILLADEPTGELDFRTGVQILRVLEEQARAGMTVLIVTHN